MSSFAKSPAKKVSEKAIQKYLRTTIATSAASAAVLTPVKFSQPTKAQLASRQSRVDRAFSKKMQATLDQTICPLQEGAEALVDLQEQMAALVPSTMEVVAQSTPTTIVSEAATVVSDAHVESTGSMVAAPEIAVCATPEDSTFTAALKAYTECVGNPTLSLDGVHNASAPSMIDNNGATATVQAEANVSQTTASAESEPVVFKSLF
jgi:hypothetical protein